MTPQDSEIDQCSSEAYQQPPRSSLRRRHKIAPLLFPLSPKIIGLNKI